MGLFRIIYYALCFTSITFMVLNYLPNLLDFEPQSYTPKLLKYEGALAVNKDLDKGQIILENQFIAPESIAELNGELYVSVQMGKIIKIKDDKIVKTVAVTPGYPLGLRFYKGKLYSADIKLGLLEIDVETGAVKVLVRTEDTIGSKKNNYLNDLDVHDGVVYFSVVSTRWNSDSVFYGIMEHENSGRLCKYDIATGKTEVLLEGLYYANGVQVTNEKDSVLVAELTKDRILRHYISGPKEGTTEVFTELPGGPDNLRRSSGGGYWVAMVTTRDESSPNLLDRLGPYPKIRKALARLSHLLGKGLHLVNEYLSSPAIGAVARELTSGSHFFLLHDNRHPVLVEVGADGKIVRSLHSTNPKLSSLSQGLELNGYLYLGSFCNPYMVKLKL